MTAFTVARVIESGVVLHDEHLHRLAVAGPEIVEQFRAFASGAAPGIYALTAKGGHLQVTERSRSRLRDGLPVRFAISPFGARDASFPKPAPPSAYDAYRLQDVVTLLTNAAGTEIFESCSAAVVGWHGGRFVFPPDDRPRVASTAEAALRAAAPCTLEPIKVESTMPIGLVNAVKGCARIDLPGRSPFPARALIEEILAATARR